jgi:hypothetical protein
MNPFILTTSHSSASSNRAYAWVGTALLLFSMAWSGLAMAARSQLVTEQPPIVTHLTHEPAPLTLHLHQLQNNRWLRRTTVVVTRLDPSSHLISTPLGPQELRVEREDGGWRLTVPAGPLTPEDDHLSLVDGQSTTWRQGKWRWVIVSAPMD